MLALSRQWRAWKGDDEDYRLPGGYDALIATLQGEAQVKYNSVASEIRFVKRGVSVITESREVYSARRVIVTLPLGVLQDHTVRFKGFGMSQHQEAIGALRVGRVVKLILRYDDPVWPRDFALAQCDHVFQDWWSVPTRGRDSVLIGWAGGPAVRELSTPPRVRAEGLRVLRLLLGQGSVRPPDDSLVVDWQKDKFARGAYSYVPKGAANAVAKLCEPVDDRLFFAGEATDCGAYRATVTGALLSGYRAAGQILARWSA